MNNLSEQQKEILKKLYNKAKELQGELNRSFSEFLGFHHHTNKLCRARNEMINVRLELDKLWED